MPDEADVRVDPESDAEPAAEEDLVNVDPKDDVAKGREDERCEREQYPQR